MNRDDEITIVNLVDFEFNGSKYEELHMSLKHINYDEKGSKRSAFSAEEVVELFETALAGLQLEEEGSKDGCKFYVHLYENEKSKKYKIVFYIEDEKVFVRLITLFRTR